MNERFASFLKIFSFIVVIFTLAVSSIFFFYVASIKDQEVFLNFSESSLETANKIYSDGGISREFVGVMTVKEGFVEKIEIVAELNFGFLGKETILIAEDFQATNYTIHNHNIGGCYPTPIDFWSPEKVLCIVCGKNKVRCWNNE